MYSKFTYMRAYFARRGFINMSKYPHTYRSTSDYIWLSTITSMLKTVINSMKNTHKHTRKDCEREMKIGKGKTYGDTTHNRKKWKKMENYWIVRTPKHENSELSVQMCRFLGVSHNLSMYFFIFCFVIAPLVLVVKRFTKTASKITDDMGIDMITSAIQPQ